MGHSPGDEPLTLKRCHSCGLPQQYKPVRGGSPSVAELNNLKGIKGKISVFLRTLS